MHTRTADQPLDKKAEWSFWDGLALVHIISLAFIFGMFCGQSDTLGQGFIPEMNTRMILMIVVWLTAVIRVIYSLRPTQKE